MSERDFEIGGRKYKLNKLDAFKQFKIVRRLAPIIGDLIPVAQKMGKLSEEQLKEDQFEMFGPIMNGIAKLSDEDSNVVLLGLCSSVEVQQMPIGNWARVSTETLLLMQDLELPVLLQIAGKAFMYNISGFFAALPAISHGG